MTRLTPTQAYALEKLYEHWISEPAVILPWLGAREGVEGSTLLALERKGLAEAKWVDKPYRRLVGKITLAGCAVVKARQERAAVYPYP